MFQLVCWHENKGRLVLIVFSYTVANKNWCLFPNATLLLLDEDVTPKLNSHIMQTHAYKVPDIFIYNYVSRKLF